MICDRCRHKMPEIDSHQHLGLTLCDDCYIDAMSPTSCCNPWAVYTASRLEGQGETFSELQEKILAMVKKAGKVAEEDLMAATGLGLDDLRKEVIPLHHKKVVQWERRPGGARNLRIHE